MPAPISLIDRTSTLEGEISHAEQHGWRLRSKTATDAQLVRGEPVNHFLHLFFAIVTLGLWLLVWIPLIIFGGEKFKAIAVDEQGAVKWS